MSEKKSPFIVTLSYLYDFINEKERTRTMMYCIPYSRASRIVEEYYWSYHEVEISTVVAGAVFH